MDRLILCDCESDETRMEPVPIGDHRAAALVQARNALRLPCYQHLRKMVRTTTFDAMLIAAPGLAADLATDAGARGCDLLLLGDEMDGAALEAAATRYGEALAGLRPALRSAGLLFLTDFIAADARWTPVALQIELRDDRPVHAQLRDAVAASTQLVRSTPIEVIASVAGFDRDDPAVISAHIRFEDGRLASFSVRPADSSLLRISAQNGAGTIELDSVNDDSRLTLAHREAAQLHALEAAVETGLTARVEDLGTRSTLRVLTGGSAVPTPRVGQLRVVWPRPASSATRSRAVAPAPDGPEDVAMPDSQTALVTGSSGFLGGHLIARLIADGTSVIGLDAAEPRTLRPNGFPDQRIDVRDAAAVRIAVLEAKPDVVYHLAAQASVSVSMREPITDIETNVLGTVHLARAAIEAGVRRFVFVSTGGALYGNPAVVPVTEQAHAAPASVYGASKLATEQYLAVLFAGTGATLSVVRPGNIYGPAQDPHGEAGVVAIFTQRMLRDEALTIFGDGSQQRDYVYVTDVVDACVRAAAGAATTCLIGTGVGTSTQTIFETLARLTGYPRTVEYAPDRPGDIQRIWLSGDRARKAWGWEPRVTLDAGMAETVAWFREREANG